MDRNKTELTHIVTNAVYGWLDERGCKPIETEVPVQHGWVADIASMVSPTLTELVNLKLLKRRPKWNQPGYREWWDVAKQRQQSLGLLTVLVEVKTSRSDFSGDKKWTLPVPTHLAYLAVPQGLVIDEVPKGWGLLEYSPAGKTVTCRVVPEVMNVTVEQQLAVVHGVAVRRDHHTRYERHRAFQKELTVTRNESISRTRVVSAMSAMKSIVRGEHGSVKAALEYYGIRHFPEYALLGLEELWERAKPPS